MVQINLTCHAHEPRSTALYLMSFFGRRRRRQQAASAVATKTCRLRAPSSLPSAPSIINSVPARCLVASPFSNLVARRPQSPGNHPLYLFFYVYNSWKGIYFERIVMFSVQSNAPSVTLFLVRNETDMDMPGRVRPPLLMLIRVSKNSLEFQVGSQPI